MNKKWPEVPVDGPAITLPYNVMADPNKGRGQWDAFYSREDELIDRLGRLPSPDEVEDMVSRLQVKLLRQMSVEVINGSIVHVKGGDRLNFIRLLGSWTATAEETASAGRQLRRILSRRKKSSV